MDMDDCMLILIQFLKPLTSCEIACGKNRLKFLGRFCLNCMDGPLLVGFLGGFSRGILGSFSRVRSSCVKKGNCTTQSGPRTSLNSMDGICQEVMVISNHHFLVLLHIYPTR